MKRFIVVLSLLMLLSNHAFAADQWAKGEPAASQNPSDISTLIGVNNEAIDRLLKNYISTVRINFNSSAQITVTAGEVVCSNTAATVRRLRSNSSSTTVTWSSIDTGSEESSKTYYVYALADTDAETFTCKITLSSSYPSGATYYKKIGSFYNDANGNITDIDNDSDVAEIGDITDKSSSYGAQQATSDGEVYVKLVASLGTDTQEWAIGYTNNKSDPDTSYWACSVGRVSTFQGYAYTNSFTMPVKKGDYWKVVLTGSATISVGWRPKQ